MVQTVSLQILGLLLKERFCSQKEQIRFIKSSIICHSSFHSNYIYLSSVIGTETAMDNDAPPESLSQKFERYFSLLILFIYGQNMISNDVN